MRSRVSAPSSSRCWKSSPASPLLSTGFFAVLTVAPAMRQLGHSLGMDVAPNSALAAGGVMGIMLIPFIRRFPTMPLPPCPSRCGTAPSPWSHQGETIRKVLLPAALPGIVGGVLLALSRAIGETMIVVMAAGLIAKMTANPLDSVTHRDRADRNAADRRQ